jgi:hypothetical protein
MVGKMKHITFRFSAVALCVGLVVRVSANEFFTSPTGSPQGDGSRLRPWDLVTALADNTKTQNVNKVVKPGDTVWLRGGTYGTGTNNYYCTLSGTSNSPIVVRGYPGERAVVDGEISDKAPNQAPGSFTTFWGFEVTSTARRTNDMSGRLPGLTLCGSGHKIINMVIHDTSEACIGFGSTDPKSIGPEVYGCILWGCGIYDTNSADGGGASPSTPWTRGSPIYAQNQYGTVLVSDVISSRHFTTAMKAYTQGGYANGFTFTGNIMFGTGNQGLEIDSENNSITNATVVSNYVYHCNLTAIGHQGDNSWAQLYGLTFSNNYIVEHPGEGTAALWLKRWADMRMVGNTIVTVGTNAWLAGSGLRYDVGGHFVELYFNTNYSHSYTINSNSYYGGVEQDADWYSASGTNYGIFYRTYQPFRYEYNAVSPADGTNGLLSFYAWTNVHGFDLNSTYSTNLPSTNVVIVRPNKYETGRGHVVIFNWQSNSVANVDISSLGLTDGQRFEVRDAQNYLGTPCITTNYSAAQPVLGFPLTLTNMTPLTPVGDINPATFPSGNPDIHTASLFNAFVLLPLVSGTGLLPPTALRFVP